MGKHRKRPHNGTHRCEICNWLMSAQAFGTHKQYHTKPRTGMVHSLIRVKDYNGPAAVIPIGGMNSTCPECGDGIVCRSHFFWHWKEAHSEKGKRGQDDRAVELHLRCNLCGHCMSIASAALHVEYHCLCTVFPQMHKAIGRRDGHVDEFNLSLCKCETGPDAPRSFPMHVMTLCEAQKKGAVSAMVGAMKQQDLVKEFLLDNANAYHGSCVYAIVQVDPHQKYTMSEFLQRVLYIGSSHRITDRHKLPYHFIPHPGPRNTEVQYRIRLGATIDGNAIWQFNESDLLILETFVMFHLSLRNLWNREYPASAQGWLLNDRFVKFSPVCSALSAVVLYGAYEELVAPQMWNDPRVLRFEPPRKQSRTNNAQATKASASYTQRQEVSVPGAYNVVLDTTGAAGTSIEVMSTEPRVRMPRVVDKAIQTDAVVVSGPEGLPTCDGHVAIPTSNGEVAKGLCLRCSGRPGYSQYDRFQPDSHDVFQGMPDSDITLSTTIVSANEFLNEQDNFPYYLQLRAARDAYPVSAYDAFPSRYNAVVEAIPWCTDEVLPRKETNTDGFNYEIEESPTETLALHDATTPLSSQCKENYEPVSRKDRMHSKSLRRVYSVRRGRTQPTKNDQIEDSTEPERVCPRTVLAVDVYAVARPSQKFQRVLEETSRAPILTQYTSSSDSDCDEPSKKLYRPEPRTSALLIDTAPLSSESDYSGVYFDFVTHSSYTRPTRKANGLSMSSDPVAFTQLDPGGPESEGADLRLNK